MSAIRMPRPRGELDAHPPAGMMQRAPTATEPAGSPAAAAAELFNTNVWLVVATGPTAVASRVATAAWNWRALRAGVLPGIATRVKYMELDSASNPPRVDAAAAAAVALTVNVFVHDSTLTAGESAGGVTPSNASSVTNVLFRGCMNDFECNRTPAAVV